MFSSCSFLGFRKFYPTSVQITSQAKTQGNPCVQNSKVRSLSGLLFISKLSFLFSHFSKGTSLCTPCTVPENCLEAKGWANQDSTHLIAFSQPPSSHSAVVWCLKTTVSIYFFLVFLVIYSWRVPLLQFSLPWCIWNYRQVLSNEIIHTSTNRIY